MKKTLAIILVLSFLFVGSAFADEPAEQANGGYRIALSNSFAGNAWRAMMLNSFNAYCKNLEEQGILSEYYYSSSGTDAEAQINEIRNMISQG